MGYTPFLTKAAGSINQGLQKRYEQDITKRAYMGDAQALGQLDSINPQAANNIRNKKKEKEQAGIRAANRKEDVDSREQKYAADQTQKAEKANNAAIELKRKNKEGAQKTQMAALESEQEYVESTMKESANFDTFEEAKSFVARKVKENKSLAKHAEDFTLTEEVYNQNKKIYKGNLAETDPVQSSEIMAGGLVRFVRRSGKVETVNPTDANAILIKDAEERDAELQGLRSSERAGGTNAQKVAIDAFKTSGQIRKSISNLDRGIGYIDEGAEAGIIDKYIPSITEASVKLDNLIGQMGLDVIASVTFGALSESELKFALSVAAPPNLQPEALKKWFIKKKASQEKLLSNLEEMATYLGTAGNTIPKFIEMNKKKKEGQKSKGKPKGETGAAQEPKTYTELPPANQLKIGDIVFGKKWNGGDVGLESSWDEK